jgi:acetoin utilization deacetylase AcuC-like enzyme
MRFGYSDTCLAHDTGSRHPETPDRLRAIRQRLAKRHGVEYVDADPAAQARVEAVHDPDYVAEFREFCAEGGGNWDPDTVASADTFEAALASAGLAQWAARQALAGEDGRDTPFALGRPPGHHAVYDDAMGFCFVNNAAVAAQAVLDDDQADRVAILDWDVHHGNGTQDIFYDRGDVCYLSVHEEGLYPGTGEADEVGTGEGDGATVNVPLPAGAGDADYDRVFADVFRPVLDRYDPDLLFVSAGFDAHRHDPISRMRVSTEGYARMTGAVRAAAEAVDAGLGFVLEGGYGLDTLSEGVATVHETFDGRAPLPLDADDDPDEDVLEVVADVRDRHDLA